LIAQSVDHKTLCLSFFTRPLLGIPQRFGGSFYGLEPQNIPTLQSNKGLPFGNPLFYLAEA
ncbi:hypothetical protein, partial [Klebsiella oxytoca]|uniref:hypothetical protein n=1 Tax=Klebsiella oxytoca TaxID=571 RepID=UPI001D0E1F0F